MSRSSIYHSGQVKVEKRFKSGSSVLGAYTWAKLISDTDTLTAWLEPNGGLGVQNFNNIALEKSLANYDVAHRLVISYNLDLPVGKGQPILPNLTGAGGKIVSGWSFHGATAFQTGTPLNLSTAVNNTNSFGGGSRPNSTGTSARLSGAAQQRLNRWFDTSAFTLPPPFTFGNVARTLPDTRTPVSRTSVSRWSRTHRSRRGSDYSSGLRYSISSTACNSTPLAYRRGIPKTA
jgi:hypothetical protein